MCLTVSKREKERDSKNSASHFEYFFQAGRPYRSFFSFIFTRNRPQCCCHIFSSSTRNQTTVRKKRHFYFISFIYGRWNVTVEKTLHIFFVWNSHAMGKSLLPAKYISITQNILHVLFFFLHAKAQKVNNSSTK